MVTMATLKEIDTISDCFVATVLHYYSKQPSGMILTTFYQGTHAAIIKEKTPTMFCLQAILHSCFISSLLMVCAVWHEEHS